MSEVSITHYLKDCHTNLNVEEPSSYLKKCLLFGRLLYVSIYEPIPMIP